MQSQDHDITGDAAVPGALDASGAGRLDLWTNLSQHVAVLLSLEL